MYTVPYMGAGGGDTVITNGRSRAQEFRKNRRPKCLVLMDLGGPYYISNSTVQKTEQEGNRFYIIVTSCVYGRRRRGRVAFGAGREVIISRGGPRAKIRARAARKGERRTARTLSTRPPARPPPQIFVWSSRQNKKKFQGRFVFQSFC